MSEPDSDDCAALVLSRSADMRFAVVAFSKLQAAEVEAKILQERAV